MTQSYIVVFTGRENDEVVWRIEEVSSDDGTPQLVGLNKTFIKKKESIQDS